MYLLIFALSALTSAHVITKFEGFSANDTSQTCMNDEHMQPFNKQVRGVNLGGWLVLEPWITPSLFYQFLDTQRRFGDQAPKKTGMDSYTFCTALGKKEANKQMRLHWKKWVTEEDIAKLARYGVNSLRVPVGDWTFEPYEPYIGCMDGALEELDRVTKLASKYNLDILLDIHAHKGSQNGFDNSGQSSSLTWTSQASTVPVGTTTFSHWTERTAGWIGEWNPIHKNYSKINYDNIRHSLAAVEFAVLRYRDNAAVLGIEPVNEPWELTPLGVLKDFYWSCYKTVKGIAPHWKFVMHDSFKFGTASWGGFMDGCPDIALDTHIYQAWNNPGSPEDFYSNACQSKYTVSAVEQSLPVIVGEWSLATDNCAMWLNGFNDNLPGFPKVPCDYVKCPESYLGDSFTGLPLDRSRPIQGPYGTGTSGPSFGYCPTSCTEFFDEDDDVVTRNLAHKKLSSFNIGHGWYFWNFKTEIDPKWDFMRSVEKGWIPSNVAQLSQVSDACAAEDSGEFICRAKRNAPEATLRSSLQWVCKQPGMDCTNLNMTYSTLFEQCDHMFNQYWHDARTSGATCDFGGAGQLSSPEKKIPSDNSHHSYDPPAYSRRQKKQTSDASHKKYDDGPLMSSGEVVFDTLEITTATHDSPSTTGNSFHVERRISSFMPHSLSVLWVCSLMVCSLVSVYATRRYYRYGSYTRLP